MVGIDQELNVAQSAKAAIDALSTVGPNSSLVETLRHARDVAASAMTFLGEGPLMRDKIKIAFSTLIRALRDSSLTREKIETAKDAIEDWMKLLEGATPRSEPKVLRRPSQMRRPRRSATTLGRPGCHAWEVADLSLRQRK
jgi:hypothetical protein